MHRLNMGAGWKKLGVTTKLMLVFALLIFFTVLASASGFFCFLSVKKADDEIRNYTLIRETVMAMDHGLEKARGLHKGFFLQYPHLGLQPAHEQYAQPSVREISRVITLSSKLQNLLFQPDQKPPIAIDQADVNLYLASAKRFADTSIGAVELITRRAAPEWGVEAGLNTSFLQLKSKASPNRSLGGLQSSAYAHYKDYLTGRKRFKMQSALNDLSALEAELTKDAAFSPEQVGGVVDTIVRIRTLAEELLHIDSAIAARFRDFALQEKGVAPVAAKMITLARDEVKKAERRIDRIYAMTAGLIVGITGFAIALVLYLSSVIRVGITSKIIMLSEAAADIRNGVFSARVHLDGGDELDRLGEIFNDMAARLEDLVDNLEKEVELRTKELAASEELYRRLFNHSSSGVAVVEAVDDGTDFVFKDINRSGEAIESVTREELIGKRVTKKFPGIRACGLLGVFREVWRSGEPARHPACFYRDERIEGWRENKVYKLPSGEVVTVFDDVTGQKRVEQEKEIVELRLRRAQKMEAIGLLAGGVAHDLNNILSSIVGYPDLLLLRLPDESELRQPIEAMKNAGERAAAVVADLLTVARGVAGTKSAVDLNSLVREYCTSPEFEQLKNKFPHVRFKQVLPGALPAVFCSAVHVTKCIMNLVINGVESIEQFGTVTLLTALEFPEESVIQGYNLNRESYVVLKVTDTGKGISEDDREHIFEPFYTKKVMGKTSGTGLGLSVVWNTMQDHAGAVVVESGDKGTCFTLYFPVSKQGASEKDEEVDLSALMGQGERILVVDDEQEQCDLAKNMLEHLGYCVTCCRSGEDAVASVKNRKPDLVLLDMLMEPGINGKETYKRILQYRPGQRAVIASGYSESNDVKQTLAMGAGGFIEKPYSLQAIATAVYNELEKNDADS